MMNQATNLKWRIILAMLLLILWLPSVLSLGIRPAKTELAIENGRNYKETFWVVNDDGRAFTAIISVQGEMAQYVTLQTEELAFRGDEDALPVEFTVTLPDQVPPGTSAADIVVKEVLGDSGENVVSSILLLRHKVIIQGPYPDKYIVAQLNFYEQDKGIRMVAEVQNLGKKAVDSLKTTFYVNDKEQQEHAVETKETSLPTNSKKILEANLNKKGFEQGEFEVAAVTTYDDQKLETVKILRIGEPAVDITYFNDFFIANKVNQYSLDLLNQWNQKLKNVFVDAKIKKNNQEVDSFRTKSVDIKELLAERINDYYNAKDQPVGEYSFDLVVNFQDSVQKYQMPPQAFDVEFITENEFEQLPVTGAATGVFGTGSVIALAVAASILVSGTIAYFVLRRRKGDQQKADEI